MYSIGIRSGWRGRLIELKNVTQCHDKHIYWRHSEWDFDDFQRVVVDLNIKKIACGANKNRGST